MLLANIYSIYLLSILLAETHIYMTIDNDDDDDINDNDMYRQASQWDLSIELSIIQHGLAQKAAHSKTSSVE